jgi:hypothetical protein
MVEPLAEVDVNPPGLMVMPVAPLADQRKVLFAPALMLAGFAEKELMEGTVGPGDFAVPAEPAQPVRLQAPKLSATLRKNEQFPSPRPRQERALRLIIT